MTHLRPKSVVRPAVRKVRLEKYKNYKIINFVRNYKVATMKNKFKEKYILYQNSSNAEDGKDL